MDDGIGSIAHGDDGEPRDAERIVGEDSGRMLAKKRRLCVPDRERVRTMEIDLGQLRRQVGDLRVFGEEQAIELGGQTGGETCRHVEKRPVVKVQHAQVGNQPSLRGQIGGVAHPANRQRGDVIG